MFSDILPYDSLPDNKDKCNRHAEHARTCQESWSKVSRLNLHLFSDYTDKNGTFYSSMTFLSRILLTSTSEVYGDPLVHPQPESYWGNVNPIGKCLS